MQEELDARETDAPPRHTARSRPEASSRQSTSQRTLGRDVDEHELEHEVDSRDESSLAATNAEVRGTSKTE
jgi:hypothetical protein